MHLSLGRRGECTWPGSRHNSSHGIKAALGRRTALRIVCYSSLLELSGARLEESAWGKTAVEALKECEGNELLVSLIPAILYVTDKIVFKS